MKQFSAKYFRDNLPEWKKNKDPVLSKIFYRRVSFYTAAFFSNRGIDANTVSNISTFVAVVACIIMGIPKYWFGIFSGILVNLWLILDCTDGNIARSVEAQPYGEFVDACSSYILVGVLFNVMGLRVFLTEGFLTIPPIIMVFLGALASSFDSLMRLIYQKYVVVSSDWNIVGRIAQDGVNASKIDKIRARVDQEISVGGILPLAILLGAIFKGLDIVVLLWCIYYFMVFSTSTSYLLYKAHKCVKERKNNFNL